MNVEKMKKKKKICLSLYRDSTLRRRRRRSFCYMVLGYTYRGGIVFFMEWKLNLKRKFTNYLQITCVSRRQKSWWKRGIYGEIKLGRAKWIYRIYWLWDIRRNFFYSNILRFSNVRCMVTSFNRLVFNFTCTKIVHRSLPLGKLEAL